MVRVRAVFGPLRAGHVAQTISRPPGGVRKARRTADSIKVMTLPGPSRTIIVEPIERPERAPAQPEPAKDPAPSEPAPEPAEEPVPGARPREGAGQEPGVSDAPFFAGTIEGIRGWSLSDDLRAAGARPGLIRGLGP